MCTAEVFSSKCIYSSIVLIPVVLIKPAFHFRFVQTAYVCTCVRKNRNSTKLGALGEHRPPWPRQIIASILPTAKLLIEPWWCKANLKCFGSLPEPRSGYATAISVFLAHLLILEHLVHHQNLISSSLYYPGPLHKISSQSIHNFLSNVVHKLTNKRADKPTLPKT